MTNILKHERIGVHGISNDHAIVVEVNDCGDGVLYQYSNELVAKEAEIEYIEDVDDRTGYADDDLYQAGFTTDNGVVYFLGEFMRINY
jgi:hypothetical protein